MKHQLTIQNLGKLLKEIEEKYDMMLMTKVKLSGGFLTLTGRVNIDYIPSEENIIKGNNVISINVKNDNEKGATLKITGINKKEFTIDISSTKFRNLKSSGLNLVKIQENKNQCKLRIDEDIIFTIPASIEEIEKYIK